MSRYTETWDVVFLTEDGNVHDKMNFPTYEDAEIYCMERDYVEVQEDGMILYLDIKPHYERVVE